jgi:tetratricopeptide (TPR) repeat protein/predicted Ser/Thr protein kinase
MAVVLQCPNPACRKICSIPDEEFGPAVCCKYCRQKLVQASRRETAGAAPAPPNPETARPLHSTPAGPAAAAPGNMPEQFGRYRILQKLGQGGMGAVYLAEDTQLDRKVALKVPRFLPEEDAEALERFGREARAAAMLEHPNLCPIYDVGQHNGINYLTMAFIDGKPLSLLVDKSKPLPPRQAAGLVRKLALALQEAHARGVIHRDLKPSNIMLNQRQEPVILDFGLARRVNKGDVRLTKSGSVLGTPGYMSPEQVRGNLDQIGPGTDIYSLGVILYELITGRLPFEGSVASVLAQIVTDQPSPPSSQRPDLDPDLDAICLKALVKDVAGRYATMAAMAAALDAYLQLTPVPVPPRGAAGARLGKPAAGGPGKSASSPALAASDDALVWPSTASGPPPVGAAAGRSALRKPWILLTAAAVVLLGLGAALVYVRFPFGTDASAAEEVVQARTEAEGAWAKIQGLDRGQGFGVLLDDINNLRQQAATFADQGRSPEALANYHVVLTRCQEVQEDEVHRQHARAAQAEMTKARQAGATVKAEEAAGPLCQEAAQEAGQAARSFEARDFVRAETSWHHAAQSYDKARQTAEGQRALQQRFWAYGAGGTTLAAFGLGAPEEDPFAKARKWLENLPLPPEFLDEIWKEKADAAKRRDLFYRICKRLDTACGREVRFSFAVGCQLLLARAAARSRINAPEEADLMLTHAQRYLAEARRTAAEAGFPQEFFETLDRAASLLADRAMLTAGDLLDKLDAKLIDLASGQLFFRQPRAVLSPAKNRGPAPPAELAKLDIPAKALLDKLTPRPAGRFDERTFSDRVLTALRRGEYARVIREADEAIKLDPTWGLPYLCRAKAYLEIQQGEKAIPDCNTFIQQEPDAPWGYNLLSSAYYAKGEYDKAIAAFEQALKRTPELERGYLYMARARAYYRKKEYDKALADSDKAIALDPELAGAYQARAWAYDGKGEWNKALAAYDEAIKRDPKNGILYRDRGETSYSAERYDKAILDASAALGFNSKDHQAYVLRGKAREGQEQELEKGLEDCNQALMLEQGYVPAYRVRGRIYRLKKDYARALDDFRRALERDKGSSPLYWELSETHYQMGQWSEAIAESTTAIKLDKDNYSAYIARAKSLIKREDHGKAIADCTKALELKPTSYFAYQLRGYAYYHNKQYREALKDLDVAISLRGPNADADAHKVRYWVHKSLNNRKKAEEDRKKAIQLNPMLAAELRP